MSLLCFPAVCRAGSLPASVGLLAVLFCRVEPLCDFWGQANLAFFGSPKPLGVGVSLLGRITVLGSEPRQGAEPSRDSNRRG